MNKKVLFSRERGQSMTELALILVFILLLLAGVVDLGRAFFTYMALREAAQEGALYGSTNPTDDANIETRARNASNLLQDLSSDPNADTSVTVTITGDACTGNAITVTVSYDNFPITMPFIGSFVGSQTIPISASITDTILSPSCE
jgi:Flp pilus assembly protein TadG